MKQHSTTSMTSAMMLAFSLLFSGCASTSGTDTTQSPARAFNPTSSELQGELVEVMLISDKFMHEKPDGTTYLYATTIYLVVHESDRERVEQIIIGSLARIRQDFAQFFLEAETPDLNNSRHPAIKQAAYDICNSHLGLPRNGTSFVQDIVIADWKRFSADL